MDCSPPGISVSGIIQARILEWVLISFSRGSSRPRDQTHMFYISCNGIRVLPTSTTWEAPEYSLEGLMLKLKLQYFGHLMRTADSLEKTLMLGKIEGRRWAAEDEMC